MGWGHIFTQGGVYQFSSKMTQIRFGTPEFLRMFANIKLQEHKQGVVYSQALSRFHVTFRHFLFDLSRFHVTFRHFLFDLSMFHVTFRHFLFDLSCFHVTFRHFLFDLSSFHVTFRHMLFHLSRFHVNFSTLYGSCINVGSCDNGKNYCILFVGV